MPSRALSVKYLSIYPLPRYDEYPEIPHNLVLLYSRSHSQWRIEGICIGEGYRRGMGIACQRYHFKRVYFPDNLVVITSNDKSLYLQRWLVDWDRLGIVDDCF